MMIFALAHLCAPAASPLESARRAIVAGDSDRDGMLSGAEFERRARTDRALVDAVFSALDWDGDSKLDAEPFEQLGLERTTGRQLLNNIRLGLGGLPGSKDAKMYWKATGCEQASRLVPTGSFAKAASLRRLLLGPCEPLRTRRPARAWQRGTDGPVLPLRKTNIPENPHPQTLVVVDDSESFGQYRKVLELTTGTATWVDENASDSELEQSKELLEGAKADIAACSRALRPTTSDEFVEFNAAGKGKVGVPDAAFEALSAAKAKLSAISDEISHARL